MAKTLRTSGDYTVKAGNGFSGNNDIILDSRTVIVKGSMDIEGESTTIDTATLSVEDPIIILSRNNSIPTDIDAGILISRGAANNAAFYWNEGEDVFKAVTTTSTGSGLSITDTALAKIQVATPSSGSDAATKSYVDTEIASGATAFVINFSGDDSTLVPIGSGNTIQFKGDTESNIHLAVTDSPDKVTVSLDHDLTNISSITASSSNSNLDLITSGTGDVVINDTLTFSGTASDPTATAVTKLYNKTAGGGGTGVFFRNTNISSGAVGELISKKKATALAIALG